MATKLFIFDLDGTLANLDHRLPFIKTKPKNFNKFLEACIHDAPVQWVINLLNIVRHHGEVLILSGRESSVEKETREWLRIHDVYYDYIIMRRAGDYRPDEIIKPELLATFLGDKDYQVQFIVDDRQRVVDKWRELGYHVLQCNAWKE